MGYSAGNAIRTECSYQSSSVTLICTKINGRIYMYAIIIFDVTLWMLLIGVKKEEYNILPLYSPPVYAFVDVGPRVCQVGLILALG